LSKPKKKKSTNLIFPSEGGGGKKEGKEFVGLKKHRKEDEGNESAIACKKRKKVRGAAWRM